jgi:hypothetical protein
MVLVKLIAAAGYPVSSAGLNIHAALTKYVFLTSLQQPRLLNHNANFIVPALRQCVAEPTQCGKDFDWLLEPRDFYTAQQFLLHQRGSHNFTTLPLLRQTYRASYPDSDRKRLHAITQMEDASVGPWSLVSWSILTKRNDC